MLFALCRYAHSCAFISVIELPRIPAYCPKYIKTIKEFSIYASAREATRERTDWMGLFCISIHASAREATGVPAGNRTCILDFNPRLREGGDGQEEKVLGKKDISIHASAREAT